MKRKTYLNNTVRLITIRKELIRLCARLQVEPPFLRLRRKRRPFLADFLALLGQVVSLRMAGGDNFFRRGESTALEPVLPPHHLVAQAVVLLLEGGQCAQV